MAPNPYEAPEIPSDQPPGEPGPPVRNYTLEVLIVISVVGTVMALLVGPVAM